MLNKWDCRDATFEDYLDLLTHDEETKRIFLSHYIADRQTIDHYFETNDISPLIPKIIALDYNDTLKFDLLNTVASYDTTLTVLLDTLKSIHNCVDKLHKRLYTYGHSLLHEYSEESSELLIRRIGKIEEGVSLTHQRASISYFNTAVIFYQSYGEGKYAFIMGHIPDAEIGRASCRERV